jgi:hypothetical protein
VVDGFEPHFVVIKGHHSDTLEALADLLDIDTYFY